MAGNPKFAILEKDGIEYAGPAEYIPEAVDITVDDSVLPYVAPDVQTALQETLSAGGSSRYALIFAYAGNTTNKFLQLFPGIASDQSPFTVAETSELVSLSVTVLATTSADFDVYRNGVIVASLSLVNDTATTAVISPTIPLVQDDQISVKLSSGSARDIVFSVNIKVDA